MNSKHYRSIEGTPSLFLDCLRLGAALVVVFRHALGMWFPQSELNLELAGDAAHLAVVVFFVLSGYVISFTTIKKNRGFIQYAQARLGRLYSVLLPGLVITIVAELLIYFINKDIYLECTRGNSWARYILTAGFLNEVWFYSSAPPINGPLWSLSYEFWYYAIFGLWIYTKFTWRGKVLSIIAVLITGPKILLLMPIWLMGVLAYRYPPPKLDKNISWILIFLIVIILLFAFWFLPSFPSRLGYPPLFFSGQFLTDYILGFFVAIIVWLLPEGDLISEIHQKSIKLFREITDLTFPIYVLHNPLLFLYRAIFNNPINKNDQFVYALMIVLTFCSVLGYLFNKYRYLWNKFFDHLFHKFILKFKIVQKTRLSLFQ